MASGGYSSYPSFVQYVIDASIGSYDSANNRTLVNFNAYVYVSGSSASSAGGSGDIYMNGGYVNSGSVGSWSRSRYGTVGVTSGSAWAYHDDNGYLGGISFSGSSSMAGLGSASVSGSLGGFPDYDRRPGNATFSSITRTPGTANFVINVNSVSSPASGLYYQVQYSQNGGAWTGTTNSTSFTYNLSAGSSYQFRVWAGNNDGASATSYSGTYSAPTTPGTPGPISATTPAGRSVTVSTGTASDGGATIDAYYAQASADNGTTWGTATAMTYNSGTGKYDAVFTGLSGGATYAFRVYAHNEMGNGSTASVSNIFIPSGGKKYDGSNFVNASTASRRNESNTAWVGLTITKKYVDGSWVDLT